MELVTRRRLAIEVAVCSLLVGLSGWGCGPSEPTVSDEVAVRRTAGGEIEVLTCSSNEMSLFDLRRRPADEGGSDDRETVWQMDFDPSRRIERLVLGDAPRGSQVRVRWSPDLLVDDDRFVYDVTFFSNEAKENRGVSFRLSDLDGDAVVFDDEVMTRAEFEESDACAS